MRITTKVRYGLRALLQIAVSYDGTPVPLSTISENQEISRKYLEQLVASLRREGLLGSKKGVRGGYYLTREPIDITLWDVFVCMEGCAPLVECVPEPDSCTRSEFCTTRSIWELLDHKLQQFWESFTLQDLIDKLPELENGLKQLEK
ncbi:Rrf2 family transcriptional regulator [bacterium]|jgi:Rrf2 family transcriptional regulator, cysteine metabolism repressor|nr:Rrf2 family transcriptional regulator [bacterium]